MMREDKDPESPQQSETESFSDVYIERDQPILADNASDEETSTMPYSTSSDAVASNVSHKDLEIAPPDEEIKNVEEARILSSCKILLILLVALAMLIVAGVGFAAYIFLVSRHNHTAPTPSSVPDGLVTTAPFSIQTTSPTDKSPTFSPTSLPTINRAPIQQYLENLGIQFGNSSNSEILGKALDWLIADVERNEPEEGGETNTLKNDFPRLTQRFAVFVLGLSLESPRSEVSRFGSYQQDWMFERWNDGPLNKNECDWPGITCDDDFFHPSITSINMGRMNLDGTIPSEIGLLSSLTHLDLAQNMIQGTIPDELFAVPSLKNVYLYQNYIVGTLPKTLSNSITHLHLSQNRLGGSIPEIIQSDKEDVGLYYLNLYKNQLTGSLPQNLALPFLYYFDVGYNQLTGILPENLASESFNLRHLHLDHNFLVGELPEFYIYGGSEKLLTLTLDHNELTGEVPTGGADTLLEYNLQKNNFTEVLDKNTCKLDLFLQKGGSVIEFDADCDICICEGGNFCRSCTTTNVVV